VDWDWTIAIVAVAPPRVLIPDDLDEIAANNPFQYVDAAGLEPWNIVDHDGTVTHVTKFWNPVRGILRQGGERLGLFGSRAAASNEFATAIGTEKSMHDVF
jgi:hypothetical protein